MTKTVSVVYEARCTMYSCNAGMYTDCVNVDSDEECERKAEDSQCITDPRYMLAYCRRTCTRCQQRQQTSMSDVQ